MNYHVGQRVRTEELGKRGRPVEGVICYVEDDEYGYFYIGSDDPNNNGCHENEAKMGGFKYAWAVSKSNKIQIINPITHFNL